MVQQPVRDSPWLPSPLSIPVHSPNNRPRCSSTFHQHSGTFTWHLPEQLLGAPLGPCVSPDCCWLLSVELLESSAARSNYHCSPLFSVVLCPFLRDFSRRFENSVETKFQIALRERQMDNYMEAATQVSWSTGTCWQMHSSHCSKKPADGYINGYMLILE